MYVLKRSALRAISYLFFFFFSRFRRSVAVHKLNFEFMSQTPYRHFLSVFLFWFGFCFCVCFFVVVGFFFVFCFFEDTASKHEKLAQFFQVLSIAFRRNKQQLEAVLLP